MQKMGITKAQYDLLVESSARFLEKETFSPVQLEEVMEQIFSAYVSRSTDDAKAWQVYWSALELYQENGSGADRLVFVPGLKSFDSTLPASI